MRLAWMVGGNIVLLSLAVVTLQEPPWTLSARDAVFWAVVAAVVALRYIDVTRLRGRTLDGEVATLRHFVRYSIGLVGVSALVWALAHSVELPT